MSGGLATILLLAFATTAPVDELRTAIEAQFRAATGLGFVAFDCAIPETRRVPSQFPCDAVDEEGDAFRYVITVDAGGSVSTLTLQPFSQLPEPLRELLGGPIDAFVAQAAAGNWAALHAGFAQPLQDMTRPDGLRSQLGPLFRAAGTIAAREPGFYRAPQPGEHHAEVLLRGAEAPLSGRFSVQIADDGTARLLGFLIVPEHGTALHREQLQEVVAAKLSDLVGTRIDTVEISFEKLALIGDAAEGMVTLSGGDQLPVWAERHGSPFDFDENDFTFSILDAAWLLRRQAETVGRSVKSIACPEPIVPDGETMQCTLTYADGSAEEQVLGRLGGDHRLLSSGG